VVTTTQQQGPRALPHQGPPPNITRNGEEPYFTIIPISDATKPGLIAAQNNHGISATHHAASVDFGTDNNSLSAASMTAAGFAPGMTPTVDGVQFRLPANSAAGNDNIVATGQTITLDLTQQSQNTARYVDLLVLASWGPTPSTANTQVTFNYTDSLYDSAQVPVVPNWWADGLAAPQTINGTSTITNALPRPSALVSYRGLTATTIHPMIYHLHLLLAHNQQLTGYGNAGVGVESITLPNYGTSFLPGQTALHILAVAVSN